MVMMRGIIVLPMNLFLMLSAELVCRLVSTPARPCTGPAATISTFASSSVPIVQDARLLGKPQQRGGAGQQAAPPSYRWTNKARPIRPVELMAIVGTSAGAWSPREGRQ
jgi:hypothetical protein